MTDQFRSAMADSVGRRTPSAAPLALILKQGRSCRSRRRASWTAVTACAVAAALALPFVQSPRTQVTPSAPGGAQSLPSPGESSGGAQIFSEPWALTSGTVNGQTWWVMAIYYPVAPDPSCGGLDLQLQPGDLPSPVHPTGPANHSGNGTEIPTTPSGATPQRHALVFGASTEEWTITQMLSCETSPVDVQVGANDGPGTLYGSFMLNGGAPKGSQIYTGRAADNATDATMTLTDGTVLTAKVSQLPGTRLSVYSFVALGEKHWKSVDQYDVHHHLVSHKNL